MRTPERRENKRCRTQKSPLVEDCVSKQRELNSDDTLNNVTMRQLIASLSEVMNESMDAKLIVLDEKLPDRRDLEAFLKELSVTKNECVVLKNKIEKQHILERKLKMFERNSHKKKSKYTWFD